VESRRAATSRWAVRERMAVRVKAGRSNAAAGCGVVR